VTSVTVTFLFDDMLKYKEGYNVSGKNELKTTLLCYIQNHNDSFQMNMVGKERANGFLIKIRLMYHHLHTSVAL
jgi:hypothetical protein